MKGVLQRSASIFAHPIFPAKAQTGRKRQAQKAEHQYYGEAGYNGSFLATKIALADDGLMTRLLSGTPWRTAPGRRPTISSGSLATLAAIGRYTKRLR